MKNAIVIIVRVLMGLFFVVVGLDGFFNFLPLAPMPDKATALIGALIDSGYMWQLVKGSMVVAGALLLVDLYVPLALIALAPIVLNIFLFLFFLNPGDLPIGIVVSILELILAWFYKDSFMSLLSPRTALAEKSAVEQKASVG